MKITDVCVSGDIQLEQEGLSGLYDPQVEIDLFCTFYNFPCALYICQIIVPSNYC